MANETVDQVNDQKRALTDDEKVDVGSEDSMDGSDPVSVTAPGDNGDPVPSSGYDKDAEEKDARDRKDG